MWKYKWVKFMNDKLQQLIKTFQEIQMEIMSENLKGGTVTYYGEGKIDGLNIAIKEITKVME